MSKYSIFKTACVTSHNVAIQQHAYLKKHVYTTGTNLREPKLDPLGSSCTTPRPSTIDLFKVHILIHNSKDFNNNATIHSMLNKNSQRITHFWNVLKYFKKVFVSQKYFFIEDRGYIIKDQCRSDINRA